ncbi:MAG: hypothetical protein KDD62_08695 [Bdellovibrionales bacterium]|nr:hypothetical protein [Bdellovibrionales bacterium]
MEHEEGFKIYLCHAYLNTLYAGFQGKYARLRVLESLLGDDEFTLELEDTCPIIDNLSYYLDQLWKHNPINFNTDEESFCDDALECINYFYILEAELIEGVHRVSEILCKPEHLMTYEDLASLAGHIVQRAYTREHYIKGLIQYGSTFELAETQERWQQHLLSCESEINSAHRLYESLLNSQTSTPLLVAEFREESLFIPSLLECQIHDMNQVSHLHHDDFIHRNARVLGDEHGIWEAAGIPAQYAGYWKAYGFHPMEVYDWLEFGFQEPALAGAWFGRGFDPHEALVWANAGYTPKEAFRCIQAGLATPDLVEEWQEADEILH